MTDGNRRAKQDGAFMEPAGRNGGNQSQIAQL
jgi:hypothetical protein